MLSIEDFSTPALPTGFHWHHEPTQWHTGNGLVIRTDPGTDFWQRTHYGFCRDNGHFLYMPLAGDFRFTAHLSFQPSAQYDQCGLMVRIDHENWIKTSIEYETAAESRLGSVVTNLGYSDWATQTISSSVNTMHYRINRRGSDFRIEAAEDGHQWQQLRITHLHKAVDEVAIGLYACSPTGTGFSCRVSHFETAPNDWYPEET